MIQKVCWWHLKADWTANMSGLVRVQSFAMDGGRLNYSTWGPLVHRTFFHSSTKEMSMAMQQEAVHWRYLPLICLAYFSGLNFREYAHISRHIRPVVSSQSHCHCKIILIIFPFECPIPQRQWLDTTNPQRQNIFLHQISSWFSTLTNPELQIFPALNLDIHRSLNTIPFLLNRVYPKK